MNHTPVTVTPPQYVDGVEGWNPWRELRRREHIEFGLCPLPATTGGAIYWPRGSWAAIVIDPALSREERSAALTHELIHDERGGGVHWPGAPASWRPRAAIDERQVDDEVARRLVPAGALLRFARTTVEMGVTVDASTVAEEFEVPEPVAERALVLLEKQTREGLGHGNAERHDSDH